MNDLVSILSLLDLSHTAAAPLFARLMYPWEALAEIPRFVRELGVALSPEEYERRGDDVWVARSAKVFPSAYLAGPTVIGPNTEVRPGAFIRGGVLVGADCVVGNSTELKNVILFDKVQVPHYNYVGDSILGYGAHMGAGSITSNVKADKSPVVVKTPQGNFDTGRKKFGAILGDRAEIGCNAVLNPGSIVGRDATVYPLSMVRGCVPAGSIYKQAGEIAQKHS